ncbi:MAG: type II toxin-antitoxin system VapB family antitoxin [Synechococcus sp.]
MNIKDPQVHAMARQLAARRGTTVTDAVRQALAAELERSADRPDTPAQLQKARREELERLLQRFRRLHWPDQRSSEELQAELYDEHGLPI